MSELNLPPAPDGHFWRISSVLGLVQVQLRKRVWFFSVNRDTIIPLMDGTDEEAAEWAAHEILGRRSRCVEHRQFMSRNGGDR